MERESAATIISALFILSLYSYSLYYCLRPRTETWVVTVFDYAYYDGTVHILSFGEDRKIFDIEDPYNFTIGKTYRIIYIVRWHYRPKILRIEPIETGGN